MPPLRSAVARNEQAGCTGQGRSLLDEGPLQPVVVVEVFDPDVGAGVLRDGVKGACAVVSADDHCMVDDFAACVTDHDDGSA